MRLVFVSGFLGSGKTTLIIRLVKAAVTKQIKVAVLVNEVGEIGIDELTEKYFLEPSCPVTILAYIRRKPLKPLSGQVR